MDNYEKMMIVEPVRWSKAAAAVLSAAVPYATADDLELQVKNGAKLFRVKSEKEVHGYYVLRIDMLASGAEGVLAAGAGHVNGIDITTALLPHIEKQFIGCQSIRIHTARPGLARKLARQGYDAGEIVLRKKL